MTNHQRHDNHILAKQEIIIIEQKIEWFEKKQVTYQDFIYLYSNSLKTSGHVYPLNEVFDISYRWSKGQIGFLYIHTTGGVRTFHIQSDPRFFISEFRRTSHL
ncbi:hypothetical protein SAMN05192534_107107 [Alteribacillus persepolensis]|uniref:PH domain-containing protein n=1 Tax=Alteribacillus persepolensis TaxID=568899 RepID=A0A1G8DIR9_9BACI|nr:hypothetical protein [Alteribacillus persepolensis]SDH57583.1 hypothetical protein SAMN05192534_107107 [Alteribacillus persepolensis]